MKNSPKLKGIVYDCIYKSTQVRLKCLEQYEPPHSILQILILYNRICLKAQRGLSHSHSFLLSPAT